MQSTEIAPRIHRIACVFGGDRIVYCHLLVGRARSLLIDTGMSYTPDQDLLPYMASIGVNPETLDYVLITHSDVDHQGGNDLIRAAAPRARFMAHNLDIPWIETPEALVHGRYLQFMADHGIGPDVKGQQETLDVCRSNIPMDIGIEGGEVLRLSPDWHVQLVHTPGHTWGHTGVYDPVSKTFIAAESALWNSILGKDEQPVLPPTYCYVNSYLATIERLHGMDIQMFSPAHWSVQTGNDVKTFLDESKNYCLHVEQKLLTTLQASDQPLSLKALIARLKPDLGTWPDSQDDNLAYPFAGNLRRLEDRGLVQRGRDGDNFVTWSTAKG